MSPALAAICGFVDAIARREVGPPQSLAAAHINDIWIGGRKGQRADRARRLAVENRIPRSSEVISLPNPAVVRRHEEDVGLIGNSGDGDRASGTERSNAAPAQLVVGNGGCLLSHCTQSIKHEHHCTHPSQDRHFVISSRMKLQRINGYEREAEECALVLLRKKSKPLNTEGTEEQKSESPIRANP